MPESIADRFRLFLALHHSVKLVVTGTFGTGAFTSMHAMPAAGDL